MGWPDRSLSLRLAQAWRGLIRVVMEQRPCDSHPAATLLMVISVYALGFSMGMGFQHLLTDRPTAAHSDAQAPPLAQKAP